MVDDRNTDTSFVARFSSLCDYCGTQITAGDTVIQLDDHLYICMGCHGAGVDRH